MAIDLLDELVHQFSDPFAFYRELIQNSIDSGSSRIEVVLGFESGRSGKKKGLAVATVSDWGEGMNRKVIEDYLLTKFRSSKEHDLTKIGKFGIGFVSVFACAPDAVVVDTGRDGEFWRVLFKADKSYELLKLEQPVEGTRVAIHKRMGPDEYDEFWRKSLESVKRWCKHSEADIAFAAGGPDGGQPGEPKSVNEPFTVDAPYQVEHKEEGTVIAAGVGRAAQPQSGLYNRGLTLLETNEPFVPGVALKIASRWLEHTLTRDNVRRDQNFQKAIAQATRLAKGPLLDRLPDELRRCAAGPDTAADWQVLFQYALKAIALRRTFVRQPGGGVIAGGDVERFLRTKRCLYTSADRTPLVGRLIAAGIPVIEGTPTSPWVEALVEGKDVPVQVADERWIHAEPSPTARAPAFCAAMLGALEVASSPVKQVVVTRLFGAPLKVPWALVDDPGKPQLLERARLSPFDPSGPAVLTIDVGHAQFAPMEPLLDRAPRLAALLLTRRMAVAAGQLDQRRDWAITQWALT